MKITTCGCACLWLMLAWTAQASAQGPYPRAPFRSSQPPERYWTATLFTGPTTAPGTPWPLGASFGGGFGKLEEQPLAWEVEFAASRENPGPGAASLGSLTGNLVMNIPFRGRLLYGTAGGGIWGESIGDSGSGAGTLNMGGGAKFDLTDGVWLRVDYRAFLVDVAGAGDRRRRFYVGIHVGAQR